MMEKHIYLIVLLKKLSDPKQSTSQTYYNAKWISINM